MCYSRLECRLCYELRSQNLDVTGIDYSARAIHFARAFCPEARFVVADLASFHPDRTFDVIFLMETLEHLAPDQVPGLLDNLHRCLSDRGKLILSVPTRNLPVSSKHYQHFGPDDLARTVEPLFEVVKTLGHIRMGLKRRLFRMMMRRQFVFGALQAQFRLFRKYYELAEGLFRSIEKCHPEQGERLLALCRKTSAARPAGREQGLHELAAGR